MGKYRELNEKVVFITGGTQGIGEAMAKAFLAEGSRVIIHGRKLNEKVQRVMDRTGADCSMGNLSDAQIAQRIVTDVEKNYGKIDVLICNAAGMSMSPFLEKQENWWEQIDINLTGHVACMQAALPGMRKRHRGTIIIISSFFGTLGWNNATGYGASKSGLLTLGQYLSKQYEKFNINVCTIVPGVVNTPQLNVDARDLGITHEEVCTMYAKEIAMQRIADPAEIASVALFMATEDGGRGLNGRHLIVSGGEYRSTPYYL